MNKTLTLYRFKVRERGKWIQTRHRMTLQEAAERYGEGNYQVLEWTKEEREVHDPGRDSAAHLQSAPGIPGGDVN